ncbi:Low-density lipoprotein receptor domain class A [Necator americanus]|uniref:Low-density lipoprotein receptor domain class A n=1 Tax=Necator americanus TaxID=51031 RepID=W2SSP3_NECAM|nr:Low-density lipoprotein receptor domain class A [Necator americanus]ETN71722.1 Low-density lipoprotein receptor domain class A [Necator americanus]
MTCIHKRFLCDGNVDCADRSDEDAKICSKKPKKLAPGNFRYSIQTKRCPATWFFCGDGTNCIEPRYVCDHSNDCRDGSDEGEFCRGWDNMRRNAHDKVIH